MRIFVACATGAVGGELVPEGSHWLDPQRRQSRGNQERGRAAAVADGLDAAALMSAVRAVEPDVVVDEMTDLGAVTDLRHFDRAFATTDRLRTEGIDILLAAARAAGAKLFIAQSFCGWTFSRTGSAIKSESNQLDPHPPREFRRTLQPIQYLEGRVTVSSRPAGIVLRCGALYGKDTGISPRLASQDVVLDQGRPPGSRDREFDPLR